MPEHQGSTDQVERVELPSAIQRVRWTERQVAAGGEAGLEVITQFVGPGSEMKIELIEFSGKKWGKLDFKINSERFWKKIEIPEEAKDALFANVKLPKHGLELRSNLLVVLPPVEITNLAWDRDEARSGDVVKLTADIEGAPQEAEAEIEIWEYDSDEAHDFITKLPAPIADQKIELDWEYVYHEDKDEIPTQEELERYGNAYNPPEYFFTVEVNGIKAGMEQESRLLTYRDWIEVLLTDGVSEPIPEEPYILYLPDGTTKEGDTDDKGLIQEKGIPPGTVYIEFPSYFELYEVEGGEFKTETTDSEQEEPAPQTSPVEENDTTSTQEEDTEAAEDDDRGEGEREGEDEGEDQDDTTSARTQETPLDEDYENLVDPDGSEDDQEAEEPEEEMLEPGALSEEESEKEYGVSMRHAVTGRRYHLAVMYHISVVLVDENHRRIRRELPFELKNEAGQTIAQGTSTEEGVIQYSGLGSGEYSLIIDGEAYPVTSVLTLKEKQVVEIPIEQS